MTRPKTDPELRTITDCVAALERLDDGQRLRALDYLNNRYSEAPMVADFYGSWHNAPVGPMIHDDESDEEERSKWPANLDDDGPGLDDPTGDADADA